MPSGLWLPRRYLKPTSVVFYWNQTTNHIINAILPEIYPVPYPFNEQGYQKIVCRSAHELQIWSQKLRDQERREQEIEQAHRKAIEAPVRDALRRELIDAARNAHDNLNRDAARHALAKVDEMEGDQQRTRTSYQHMEAREEKRR